MIKEIKMWSANCDVCNTQYEYYDGIIALNDKGALEEDIIDSWEWVLTTEGKVFCSDCHQTSWNETTDENEVFSKDEQQKGATFLGIVK